MGYREDIEQVNQQLDMLQNFRTTVNNQLETLEKKVLELQLKAPKSGEKTVTRKKKLTLSKP